MLFTPSVGGATCIHHCHFHTASSQHPPSPLTAAAAAAITAAAGAAVTAAVTAPAAVVTASAAETAVVAVTTAEVLAVTALFYYKLHIFLKITCSH